MKNKYWLVMCVLGAVGAYGPGVVKAQEESAPPHKVTAQEVAEALADPSASIKYFNAAYRLYQDAGLNNDQENQEMRLNGAGFIRLPESSILYRAYLPLYATEFPFDDRGVGDALLSAYWVPGKGNFILGYGGAMMAPTASEDYFGTGKWSAGPTLVVAEKVPGNFTLGALFTHVWSFAGDSDRDGVSMTTIQPAFTKFVNKKGTSVTVGSETTYNWNADDDQWQVPVSIGLSQILPPIGKQFIGVVVGASYYAVKADYTQEWDIRAAVSVVFP